MDEEHIAWERLLAACPGLKARLLRIPDASLDLIRDIYCAGFVQGQMDGARTIAAVVKDLVKERDEPASLG